MQGKGLICEGHLLKLTNASRTKRTQQPNKADNKIEAWHPLTIQKRVVVSTCVCVCVYSLWSCCALQKEGHDNQYENVWVVCM